MLKRGFTIVELAIVLLIIGILIGMVVKGYNLKDISELQAEVSKVQRLKGAVVAYMSKAEEMMPLENGKPYDLDMSPLIEQGFLSQKDTKSTYLEDMEYKYVKCKSLFVDISIIELSWVGDTGGVLDDFRGSNICLTSESGDIPLKVICAYENMVDDNDGRTGEGRGVKPKQPKNTPSYRNCDDVIEEEVSSYRFIAM